MALRELLNTSWRYVRNILTTLGVCTVMIPAASYGLAVFDANNYIQNQLTALKLTEELTYVIETYNQISNYVSWVGSIADGITNFTQNPTRIINEVVNCVGNPVNTAGNTLCGQLYKAASELFATEGSGGNVSDSAVRLAQNARIEQFKSAATQAVALGRYGMTNPSSLSEVVILAQRAGSVSSFSAQNNAGNELLVKIATQLEQTNRLLAAMLELEGQKAVREIPPVIGVSNDRFGTR